MRFKNKKFTFTIIFKGSVLLLTFTGLNSELKIMDYGCLILDSGFKNWYPVSIILNS